MYSEQKTSMIMLKVLQKTLASNVEVMVRELRIKKGKRSEFLCSFEHDGREYLFQQECHSPICLSVWSMKNAGEILFGKERPKEVCERYKHSSW